MKINRRAFNQGLAGLGVIAATSTAARARALQSEGATVDVDIVHEPKMAFSPEPVTIKVGDTVTWTNHYPIAHTVTFDPAKAQKASNVVLPAGVAPFDSGDMGADDTFSHTFTVAGTYKYVCAYHEDMGMVGSVIVA